MNSRARSFAMTTGLLLLLTITPSWGQPVCAAPGCNPTTSDGNFNTAGGTNALVNVVTTGFPQGESNTAFGQFALAANTTGGANTATGKSALLDNTTGNFNTATGFAALRFNTIGNANTAIGFATLQVNTTGNLNTATGLDALSSNTTGSSNTAIGAKALKKSLGTKNIGIGYQAGVSLVNGNNNIYIGNLGAGDEFQTIRIGTAQAQTFIAGIGTAPVSGAIVMVDMGTGQLGIGPPSSARYKQDIATMGTRSAAVLQLRPVTFTYRSEPSGTAHYGLVAEEVAAVYPELVTRTASGEVQTVKYHELIPMLLNELQREHLNVATLKQELAELRSLVGSRPGR